MRVLFIHRVVSALLVKAGMSSSPASPSRWLGTTGALLGAAFTPALLEPLLLPPLLPRMPMRPMLPKPRLKPEEA